MEVTKLNVVTAPEYKNIINTESVFIAGGITDCPDWQLELINHLNNSSIIHKHYTFYNPRRKEFDVSDPTQSEIQIVWEYKMLQKSKILFFWFCKETLNPITLYELGKWANSNENTLLVVGCDPEYARKDDVRVQTMLARPNNFSYCENFEEFKEKCVNMLNLYSNVFKTKLNVLNFMPTDNQEK